MSVSMRVLLFFAENYEIHVIGKNQLEKELEEKKKTTSW